MGQNRVQNEIFFAISSSLVHQFSFKLHRIIAWNNALLPLEVKFTKKNWWTQIWTKRVKIGPEIKFFTIFSDMAHQLSIILYRMIAWNNVSLLVQIKLMRKTDGLKLAKTELKLGFSPFSQVCLIKFYLNCTECQFRTMLNQQQR